ncbi:MAG: hypothetical protein ACI9K1_001048 [Arcticibacterium sp.]
MYLKKLKTNNFYTLLDIFPKFGFNTITEFAFQ